MPTIDPSGVSQAFLDFFDIGPVAWGLSIIVGGTTAAFLLRLLISSFWR